MAAVSTKNRQEAATDGCSGISGPGKHRPLAAARVRCGRYRPGALPGGSHEIAGTFLPVLFDEFHAHSRFDSRVPRPLDVAASDERPMGNHHPAFARICRAHTPAPCRFLSPHCFLWHEASVRGLARPREIEGTASIRSSANLFERRSLPSARADLLRDLAITRVRLRSFIEAAGR